MVRVGLIGLGNVGLEVARLMLQHRDLLSPECDGGTVLGGVAVRSLARERDLDLGDVPLSDDARSLVTADSIDVVIELMGGLDPALSLVTTALSLGKDVITANKMLMAHHGQVLTALAAEKGSRLFFSAAVGGGAPIIEALTHSLRGERLSSIDAVLNGTTNFILDSMADGGDYAAALAVAQREGYAETDPSDDVTGADPAAKLAICASLAWGTSLTLSDVKRQGITYLDPIDLKNAATLGCAVKLLARAQQYSRWLQLSVRPTLIPLSGHPLSSLAHLHGPASGAVIQGTVNSPVTVLGSGAGPRPTASAVLSDLGIAVAGGLGPSWPQQRTLESASPDIAETGAYLRLRLNLQPTLGADQIVQLLEDRGVAVETTAESGEGIIVVLTRAVPEAVMDRALETLDSLGTVSLLSRLAYTGAAA